MAAPLLPDDAVDDDLQRRIGRNLLVFARIEANFKKLMSVNRISFALALGMSAEEAGRSFRQAVEGRATAQSRQTLGALAGDYMAEVMTPDTGGTIDPPEGQFLVSLGYERTPGAEGVSAVADRLRSIVDERNALVHHLIDRLDTGAPEQLNETRQWLDAQHTRAMAFLTELRDELHNLGEARKALFNSLQRVDWATALKRSWSAESPLAAHFSDYATNEQRGDGWTDYGQAAKAAYAAIPDELANLKAHHGVTQIRKALEATGVFEFKLEPTTGGGRRLLYRPRPDDAPQAPEPLP